MTMRLATRVRRPRVAGYYYPQEPDALREQLEMYTSRYAFGTPIAHPPSVGARAWSGAIVPHGSYAFSGAIAGATYQRLRVPARCIVLAPNHAGVGARWSLMSQGAYATPLGEVPIDEALAQHLRQRCDLLEVDELAHQAEHAIEVQLPFLQWLGPIDGSIVPVVINSEEPAEWEQMAEALAQLLREEGDVLLFASADFSHYVPQAHAQAHTERLLRAISHLDVAAWCAAVHDEAMITCALAPVACLLGALARIGATQAEVVRTGTSAEAGGDPQSVTGYAGVVIR
jgi:AmmeMemoRadiSam system protein B